MKLELNKMTKKTCFYETTRFLFRNELANNNIISSEIKNA